MPSNRKGDCSVCRHPDVVRIEDARAAGVALETLAEKYNLSRSAIHRHWHKCTDPERKLQYLVGPTTIAQAREKAAAEGGSVLDYLTITRSVLVGQMMAQAEASSAYGVATSAGRLLDVLREIGRLTGEIARAAAPSTTVNVSVGIAAAAGFPELQAGLLQIARDYPAARADIVSLLRRLDGSPEPAPRAMATIEHEAAE